MKTVKNTNTIQRLVPPRTMLHRLILGASVTLALAVGCSSSDDDGNNAPANGVTSMIGFVSIDVDDENGALETGFVAFFNRFSDTMNSAVFVDSLTAVLDGDDICFIGDERDQLEFELGPLFTDTVSAGETMTFSSPAVGTYATLERQTAPNPFGGSDILTAYTLPGDALAGSPPAGLTLDIPGDVFPAFSNVAVPDVPPALNDFVPAKDSPIDATTTFNWTPSGIAGALISFGIENGAESIECLLDDDGSFTLPESVTAQLTDTLNGTVGDVDRGSVILDRSGSAALAVFAERG